MQNERLERLAAHLGGMPARRILASGGGGETLYRTNDATGPYLRREQDVTRATLEECARTRAAELNLTIGIRDDAHTGERIAGLAGLLVQLHPAEALEAWDRLEADGGRLRLTSIASVLLAGGRADNATAATATALLLGPGWAGGAAGWVTPAEAARAARAAAGNDPASVWSHLDRSAIAALEDQLDPLAAARKAWLDRLGDTRPRTEAEEETGRVYAVTYVHPSAEVDPTAIVHDGARIEREARVAAGAIVEAGARIGDRTRIARNAFVGPHVRIGGGCRIGEGCQLRARSKVRLNTVLADRVIVGEDAEIANDSRLEQEVQVGAGSTVGNKSTIEARTAIGARTDVGDDARLGPGAEIGSGVRIGKNATLGSVTVGDDHQVAAGATAESDAQVRQWSVERERASAAQRGAEAGQ